MGILETSGDDLLKTAQADTTYFKNHPEEQFYFRDPFPGEWLGFHLVSPVHSLTVNTLDHLMEGMAGSMKPEILVVNLDSPSGKKMHKWPAFHHEGAGHITLRPEIRGNELHLFQVDPLVMKENLQEMLNELSPEEVAEQKYNVSLPCSRCGRNYRDGEIVLALQDGAVCESCRRSDDEILGVGIHLTTNTGRTEEEEEVIRKALTRVEQLRLSLRDDDSDTELQ